MIELSKNEDVTITNAKEAEILTTTSTEKDADDVSTGSDTVLSDGHNKSVLYSFVLYDALADICRSNFKYYECDDTETGQRFCGAFRGILDHIDVTKQHVSQIVLFAHEYDFDEDTPGNGYRSFVKVVQSCITHSLKVSKYIAQNRSYLLFRRSANMKEIEACSQLLASLCKCLEHLLRIRENSDPGSLFPNGEHTAEGLFDTSASINQYCFYGRCLGFHYHESMQSVLKFLSICLAGFSEAYYKDGNRIAKATSSMWTGGKYYWNPELRARRIVNLSQNAGIDFCKAFWSLTETELMYALPNMFGVKVKVNKLITIPPEPLEMQCIHGDNEMIEIPIPTSHLGPGSVTARLLSSIRREGMFGERNKRNMHSPSNALIFHCHGGGFVAQSSKSHEVYLREWAVKLHIPILSIDYSLAPQAAYPRALEEVFYAYCWAIKNCHLLGTTAQRIVVVGDSAGANLNLALTLKCIDYKIRRPDGVFMIYCPVKMSFDPSPARLLCLLDPLLPFGFLMRCLKAYVHPGEDPNMENKEKILEDDQMDENENQKVVNSANNSSTNSAVIVTLSDCDSEMLPTFVHVDPDQCENDQDYEKNGDNSASLDGSSMWERIEHDADYEDANKSPDSDGTSDTFASASLQNSQTGANTDLMTPDESNGISFEEDSQPITLQKPINGKTGSYEIRSAKPNDRRQSTSSSIFDLDSPEAKSESAKFVEKFVEKYAHESGDTASGLQPPDLNAMPRTKSEENILLDESRDAINVQGIPQQLYKAVETAANSVANTFTSMTATTESASKNNGRKGSDGWNFLRHNLNAVDERNAVEEFQFKIPKDPFISPFYASDEMLLQMPRVHVLSVDADPCLDDCIMFAKKLKALNKPVGLDILSGLPHGFLSFVKLSKEAYEGNRLCITRLAELLGTKEAEKHK